MSVTARLVIAVAFAFVARPGSVRADAATEAYRVDAARSRVTIAVGKAGAFSFIAGHTHEVSGPIESGAVELDPDDPSRSQIRIVIAASALRVTGANEPPDDRPKVQQAHFRQGARRRTLSAHHVREHRRDDETSRRGDARRRRSRPAHDSRHDPARHGACPRGAPRSGVDRQRSLCNQTDGVRHQTDFDRRRRRGEGRARHRIFDHRTTLTD